VEPLRRQTIIAADTNPKVVRTCEPVLCFRVTVAGGLAVPLDRTRELVASSGDGCAGKKVCR
jgi:hypothetical protein